ncbi:MAG: NGG1p interacting factor NIF3 [bacterium]|nr:NGG1p interacting factor NIF3 [bacterium]
MYKVFVFAPRDQKIIRTIIDAAANAGAGKIGKYNKCAFITEGIGTWVADKDANPHLGEVGKLEEIKEVKIEMQCPDKYLKQVLSAIKKVHPYEEIVIDVFKMESFK